ncbi:hypothetical protein [Enhygromyxa salina]|uniref:hypothetical protein n=1 Tax=Enhygromyxa salina TaxID=215803 RepID=UPI0015E5F563|nr:hypothetical protein [Enhygromyxa salina]
MRATPGMHLDDLPIESPCDQDWDDMRPDAGGQRRWCDHCAQRVHDLSAMDERQARAFLDASESLDVCIAYAHDRAGNISFAKPAPRPQELIPVARLGRGPSASLLSRAAPLAALLSACTPHDRGEEAVRIVSDPIEDHAQPVVVIPSRPNDNPLIGPPGTEGGAELLDMPCEPLGRSEARTIKKGKRKRADPPLPRGSHGL